jgi:hypothetical protein
MLRVPQLPPHDDGHRVVLRHVVIFQTCMQASAHAHLRLGAGMADAESTSVA